MRMRGPARDQRQCLQHLGRGARQHHFLRIAPGLDNPARAIADDGMGHAASPVRRTMAACAKIRQYRLSFLACFRLMLHCRDRTGRMSKEFREGMQATLGIEAQDSLEAGHMVSRIAGGIALALIGLMTTGALAQETSTNQVAANTAWSVFEDTDPRECWAVSAPTETVNTRDGRVVAVRRGDILLMTFFRPGAGVQGQITFTGGYPFT